MIRPIGSPELSPLALRAENLRRASLYGQQGTTAPLRPVFTDTLPPWHSRGRAPLSLSRPFGKVRR